MNELPVEYSKEISNHKKPSLLDNKFLILIPIFLLLTSKTKSGSPIKGMSDSVSEFINSLTFDKIAKLINPRKIQSNVDTIKKIGPYLPETYVDPLNSIILTFEKVNRAMSLMEFISSSRPYDPIIPVATEGNKDRINKILNVVKEELPEERSKDVKPMIELVTNIDKIKGASSVITSFLDPSKKSTGSLDDLIDLILPLLGKYNIDKSKIKEMLGMMEMLKVLNEDD